MSEWIGEQKLGKKTVMETAVTFFMPSSATCKRYVRLKNVINNKEGISNFQPPSKFQISIWP